MKSGFATVYKFFWLVCYYLCLSHRRNRTQSLFWSARPGSSCKDAWLQHALHHSPDGRCSVKMHDFKKKMSAFKKTHKTLKSVFNFTLWGLPGKQLLRHLCCCHQPGKGQPCEQALAQSCSLQVGLWAHASKNLGLLQQTTDTSK